MFCRRYAKEGDTCNNSNLKCAFGYICVSTDDEQETKQVIPDYANLDIVQKVYVMIIE